MKILVLFDIDGTILTMKNGTARVLFSNFLKKVFGRPIPNECIPEFHGMTDLQILEQIADNIDFPLKSIEHNIDNLWSELNIMFTRYCTPQHIVLMPGITEIINKFHASEHIQLGLLTGNIRQNAYSKLASYNLNNYFPFGAFGDDDADRNKLLPIAVRRANQFFNQEFFDLSNTILIGDSKRDIECAKSNNVPVIAVATGGVPIETLRTHNADYVLQDLSNYELVNQTIINHFNQK